ncbi:MAG: acyl-CoA dehydrogenase [Gammaproteobacteria bacterium]
MATESEPSRAELLDRARALAPVLLARAPQAEALRKLPEETVQDLKASGLYRILQPRHWGGYELDFGLLNEIGIELGKGCGSTSWVYCNLASHHWMLGMWGEAAQRAVWRDDSDALICSSFVYPAGKATAVAGGYRLRGNWPFCSGIDCSQWIMLGAFVDTGNAAAGPGKPLAFLVPAKDYQIIDNWHVAGLCATGSHNIQVNDAFVPTELTLNPAELRGGPSPGSTLSQSPLYRVPLLASFGFVLSGVVIGIAKGTLERFVAETRSRVTTYTAARTADFTGVQLKVGEAAALIQAAELLLKHGVEDLLRLTAAEQIPEVERKLGYRRDGTYAIALATKAVDLLYSASGGRGIFDSNPIQRAFRDVHAASAHINNNWEIAATAYGRVALGLPPDNPML